MVMGRPAASSTTRDWAGYLRTDARPRSAVRCRSASAAALPPWKSLRGARMSAAQVAARRARLRASSRWSTRKRISVGSCSSVSDASASFVQTQASSLRRFVANRQSQAKRRFTCFISNFLKKIGLEAGIFINCNAVISLMQKESYRRTDRRSETTFYEP